MTVKLTWGDVTTIPLQYVIYRIHMLKLQVCTWWLADHSWKIVQRSPEFFYVADIGDVVGRPSQSSMVRGKKEKL